MDYLCGSSKWEAEGNTVNGCIWVSNLTGDAYDISDPFVVKYMKRARQQMHLTALVFETRKILDAEIEGVLDGEFIISRELYNNIMEYGAVHDLELDVQNTPQEK